MRQLQTALVALALGAVLVSVARGQDSPPALPPAHQAALDWLADLGVPSVQDLPVAHVICEHHRSPSYRREITGFVVADSADAVTMVGLGFVAETISRTGWSVDVRETSLEALAGSMLATNDTDEASFSPFGSEVTVSERASLAFLALVCRERGELDLAGELLARADALEGYRDSEWPEGRDLTEKLRGDLDEKLMWRAVLLFEDIAVPRPRILAAMESYVRCFPRGKHRDRATDTAELLALMVEEDAAHAALARPFDELSPDEQVAELIYRLRDQPGAQY